MRGIKIPQYAFALKMQGGLMREGGRICGTLQYCTPEQQIFYPLSLCHLELGVLQQSKLF